MRQAYEVSWVAADDTHCIVTGDFHSTARLYDILRRTPEVKRVERLQTAHIRPRTFPVVINHELAAS